MDPQYWEFFKNQNHNINSQKIKLEFENSKNTNGKNIIDPIFADTEEEML